MNVMLNIEELIIHLERKITEYRFHQKRSQKARIDLCAAKGFLSSLKNDLQGQMTAAFKVYRGQVETDLRNLVGFWEGARVKREDEHLAEIYELRGEIQRQHKVISAMRKEVEDLQELMIMQGAVTDPLQNPPSNDPPKQTEREQDATSPPRLFGGLQMIEQLTERTLMSSARSMQEQRFNTDAFILIQEQQEQYPSKFTKNSYQEGKLSSCERPCPSIRSHSESSCSPSEWHEQSAFSKLEQMMELSHFSQRVHSITEEPFPCYESLPISMQEYSRPGETWEGQPLTNDNINNSRNRGEESEQERQSRSKMFLQEFRRTFNKCLSSSSSSSRKNSTKIHSSAVKNAKNSKDQRQGQRDSQRLISEMLKDIDNNNKFCVGNRKAQLRYQGTRKGGVRQGQGTLYYSNGFCYQGEFKNNLRHGYGVLKYNQTEVYRGEWQADELCGQGKIRNATAVNRKKGQGSPASPLLRWVSYCGYFRNNRFEGEGKLYLQGGQKFLGKFICGAACGQGTLYRKNGHVQTGIWRNNQLVQTF